MTSEKTLCSQKTLEVRLKPRKDICWVMQLSPLPCKARSAICVFLISPTRFLLGVIMCHEANHSASGDLCVLSKISLHHLMWQSDYTGFLWPSSRSHQRIVPPGLNLLRHLSKQQQWQHPQTLSALTVTPAHPASCTGHLLIWRLSKPMANINYTS